MTGEWEEKLKMIERSELTAPDFMDGIADYILDTIRNSSQSQLKTDSWGDCPLCGKEVIKGKRAYGCSGWKEGCSFVLEPEFKGVTFSPRQIQHLLQQRILPGTLPFEGKRRLVVLSTQGEPMDLQPPSSEGQKRRSKRR